MSTFGNVMAAVVAVMLVVSSSSSSSSAVAAAVSSEGYIPMMNIQTALGQSQDQETSGYDNDVDNVPVSLGKVAEPCDRNKCKLPKCQCSDVKVPKNMSLSDVPQMLVFTFQNAVSDQNYDHYLDLFNNWTNPNDCPGVGTFFVSHLYTDYFRVQSLYAKGHEIGDNTVTSQSPASYWVNASYDVWKAEIDSQAQILNQWAQLPNTLPAGFRAPFLEMGGDELFTALRDTKMQYDASRVSIKYSEPKPGFLWPYTYDYQSTQDCVIGRCPTNAYPGVWELPLAALKDKNKTPCSTLGACFVENEDDVYTLLMTGFIAHYTKSRSPYVLGVDTAWMVTPFKKAGTLKFLEAIKAYKNVYLVSSSQALQWSQKPTPISKLKSFQPWQCSDLPHDVCDVTKATQCFYDKDRKPVKQGGVYKFRTCVKTCPKCYPWVSDPFGKSC